MVADSSAAKVGEAQVESALAFHRTGALSSSFLLGVDAFAMDAPVWILTLLGGVLADRRDRTKVIFFFQGI